MRNQSGIVKLSRDNPRNRAVGKNDGLTLCQRWVDVYPCPRGRLANLTDGDSRPSQGHQADSVSRIAF